eukprot:NODE_83_length_22684_cov_0.307934.p11 type:complete len:158 gc:universal NODE_83_length_22684_cov_0.307934:6875-6402(-)
MLNLFRISVFLLAAIVAYYGFGGSSDNDLSRKPAQRRQAGTNYFFRRECNTISQMSIVFGDGPGFNKTYEFRQACISRGLKCTFFINPVTVESQAGLKGQIDGLVADGMEIGLAFPSFPQDLDNMDQTTFKITLAGYAETMKTFIGGSSYPKFVFFK